MVDMADAPLTYGEYLRIPELLSLQQCLSSPPHHDEPLFIMIHQVYELWFKLVLHEIDTASRELLADHVAEATRLLRRVVEIQRLLIQQIRILETMRPQDFLGFRYHLNPASGFQSVQFREIEFVLGLKRAEILNSLLASPPEMDRLRARLLAPALPDIVDGVLERRGFVKGDPESNEWRLDALARIYGAPDTYADLNALCEVLVEIDECLSLWRTHHVHMVERMIGSKRGTGGSEGVGYLRTTLPSRAFPDLWAVRTRIGES
jgi:tryptophan 2,3-dioxygenase